MGRYAKQESDEELVAKGYTHDEGQEKMQEVYSARRRLYLATILNDVEAVVGTNCVPEMYAAAITAMALHDVELEVNL